MSRVASACRKLVLIQLGSPVVLVSSGITWEKTGHDFFLFFGMFLGCLMLVYALFILLQRPQCPSCHQSFLTKGDGFNIGFSLYTHKCSNCGYKLKKGE